jgi:probable phosphomutase (TIGR03848 family)
MTDVAAATGADAVPTPAAEAPAVEAAAPASDAGSRSPTRLLLVRHAVTAETGPKLTGRTPGVDLSDEGVRQAEAVAERLAPLPVAAVYASPIERTMQTAARIAARHRLDVRELAGVIEAEYGEWTGQRLADLAQTDEWKVVQATPSRARFPGGETIRAMQARMVAALEDVAAAHPHQTVVVVSHADPIKSAIAHFSGMHLDLFQRIHVAPASVTALELHTLGAVLLKLNDTGSLEELLARPASDGEDTASPAGVGDGEQQRRAGEGPS